MTDVLVTITRSLRLVDTRYRRRLALLAGANILVAAMDLLGILLLVPFLAYLGPGGVNPGFAVDIAERALGTDQTETVVVALAMAATVLFVAKGASAVVLLWIQTGVLNKAQVSLARRLLSGFINAPWLVQQDSTTSSLMRTTVTSVQSVIGVLSATITATAEAAVFIAVLTAIVIVNPALALGALIYIVAAGVGYVWIVRRPIERRGEQLQVQSERMNAALIELSGGIKELTIRGSAGIYLERYGSAISRFLSAYRLITVANQSMRYLLEVLMIGGAAFVIGFAYVSGASTTVLVSIGVLLTAGFRVLPALNMMLFSVNTIRSYEAAVRVVEDDLGRLEAADAPPGAVVEDAAVVPPSGAIEFEGVTFRYPGREIDAVSDVSLVIRPGEAVGFVGASGSGKSTLVDVMLGLLRPSTGRVLIDGSPLDTRLRSWRDHVGFVPQEIFLADDTLAANIEFGHPTAGDPEALDQAIRLAHLDRVLPQLPDGAETMLGERGARLSGGQRQRIGLARALYGDPRVLILDEATSALDNETERLIAEALDELHGRLTMIVIAHRLSTVRSCDRIVFLEHGRVTGVGTFDELRESHQGFARLVELGSLRGAF